MTALPSDQDHTGRSFGDEELGYLRSVIESGTLFAPKGTFVKELESSFAESIGVAAAVATSSGTAAIHTAVAALDLEPGDEVITTSVTDIGALTPLLYQGLIPVFADVDPETGNVDARTIANRLSPRTKAVIVTHLFGNPCDMEPIVALARREGLILVEDCAQAFGATYAGMPVGSLGDIACFSLQQGKHITAGEGGLVASSDSRLTEQCRLFVNKAWDYEHPSDHEFLALNYRMTELQGAVALAQLSKLADGVAVRRFNAAVLDSAVAGIPGLRVTGQARLGDPSYWRYAVLVDHDVIPGGPRALADELREMNVPSAPRYIQKPAFRCGLFKDQKTFGTSRWPFTLAAPEALDYAESRFPGTFELLDRILVLPWNERFTGDDVARLAAALTSAVDKLTRSAA
ncbi:MAG: DegT/DnrJ/EryC1/StrS family aminotransferase [Acidimicrobiia bacterium]